MIWFRIVLAALITIMWITGYVLAWTRQIPNTPTELSALVVIVLGWAFGGTVRDVWDRRGNGNGNGKGGDDAPKT